MNVKEDVTIRYHAERKHNPHSYARSAGFLDLANEPDPSDIGFEVPNVFIV